jgi:hypothetical protein
MKPFIALWLLAAALLPGTATATIFCGGSGIVNTAGDATYACGGTPNGPLSFRWEASCELLNE